MADYDESIEELRTRLAEADQYLAIDELLRRRPRLETEMSRPDLWDDANEARGIQTELAAVNEDLEIYAALSTAIDDAEVLADLAVEEDDSSVRSEIEEMLTRAASQFDDLELRALFAGEYDEHDAVCHIQSGAGGTDAQDWAEMLLRMYARWAEQQGLELELDAIAEGQEAGITTAEFIIKGRHAYGRLRGEHGTHRLVRISPFNNQGKRQTAFASIYVAPFFEAVADEVDIDETDLRIDTFRSSGAGGQHVNVTDSAVRITHLPSGVVVSCQNERSQHQNKDRAMQILASKLLDLERQQRDDELAEISGDRTTADFGSQIRSYVMQPYTMVKDLRSQHESSNIEAVLNGDVDQFMEAYLRWERAEAAS
ncbi:MAG: peptide chain release factor 2 [Acidobacteria bacterium]|nr:peptide chain release factor 2 [Acidobacteriota bacterium]